MNIHLTPSICKYWITDRRYFSMQDEKKFMNYFFPFLTDYKLHALESDINIYCIQEVNIPPSKKLNMILCVENCSYWKHYKHYNKYSCFGDPNVSIYFYNHIHKCVFHQNFIAIPILYLQLDYYEKHEKTIYPSTTVPFSKKKFCLIATTENDLKKPMIQFLKSIGPCDYILHKKSLKNKSCYHSTELLNYFNQYKFVFVCENSVQHGYITEKIFNCYFSHVIPIYYGSKQIHTYFCMDSFICLNDENWNDKKNKILKAKNNPDYYQKIIQCQKIKKIDKEDYQNKMIEFIMKKLH